MNRLTFLFSVLPFFAFCQYGGESSFMFLDVTNSAKVEALGGNNITLSNSDIHFAMENPALIDSTMHNDFGGTWGSMFIMQTGIGIGNVAYGRNIKGNPYTFGVRYISYGAFDGYDQNGQSIGSQSASDFALSFGTSRKLTDAITWGVQVKPIASYLADYSSYAIAVDGGATYIDTARSMTVGLLLKNVGYQLKTYTDDNQQNMPFDAQFGITKRLKHAPLRLSLTYRYLHKWDLSYDKSLDSKTTSLSGTEEPADDWWMVAGTNLLKHFVVGTEVLLGKSLYAAVGFDLKKYSEMKMESRSAGAGLSFGFGVTVSKFNISYGRSKYHAAGATNYISLTTNLDDIFAIKRIKKSNASN